jgi:hypothetical protein
MNRQAAKSAKGYWNRDIVLVRLSFQFIGDPWRLGG